MTTSEFLNKLKSKYLWLNLLAMAAIVAALVFATSWGTDLYTHHGEKIEVPKLVTRGYNDALHACEEADLIMEVTDSTYNPKYPEGYVLEQLPAAGEFVKSGRVIYVKINTLSVPTLIVPDIVGNSSSREAMALLKTQGFRLGEIEYITGEKDWVVGLRCNNRQLKFGDKVTINDLIILQVGNGGMGFRDDIVVTDMPPMEEETEEVEIYESGDAGDADDFEVVE